VFAKQLWNAELRSPFRLMPGKAKGKHGRAPFVTVGDEMHEWPSTELADTLRQGEGTRCSRSGFTPRPPASSRKRPATAVGRKPENSRRPDRGSDHAGRDLCRRRGCRLERSENAWRAANPSLGLSPTMAFLRGEIAKAVTPAAEAAFRRYHLNQWVEDFARWISVRKWDAARRIARPGAGFPTSSRAASAF
jgi:hypothetical protein